MVQNFPKMQESSAQVYFGQLLAGVSECSNFYDTDSSFLLSVPKDLQGSATDKENISSKFKCWLNK